VRWEKSRGTPCIYIYIYSSFINIIVNMEKGTIRKRKNRDFRFAWLDENSFRGWLAPHPTDNKALCTICNKAITCCKSKLLKHSKSVKHIERALNVSKESINDNNEKDILSHNDRIKRAEIKLAAFFAEHNVAFTIADHLIPLSEERYLH